MKAKPIILFSIKKKIRSDIHQIRLVKYYLTMETLIQNDQNAKIDANSMQDINENLKNDQIIDFMLRTKKTLNNLDRKWRFVRNEIVNIKYILTSLNYTAYHPDQKQVQQNNGGGQQVQCALVRNQPQMNQHDNNPMQNQPQNQTQMI